MYRSNKLKKTYIQNGRNVLNQGPRDKSFNLSYRSRTDTPTLTIVLKSASAKTKAKVTLTKMPWQSEDA